MQKRRIGGTDVLVSVLGLGTVKFGRNEQVKYPHTFSLPSDDDILNLLSHARECGINLLDTAPAYGTSESRIGDLLTNRHEWVLMSKAGETFLEGVSSFNFSEKSLIKSVETSLARCRTDYLDILLIHSNGEDEKIIFQDEVFVTLDKLKSAGKIKCGGMSTKTVAGGLLTIQHADVAMMTYRPDYLDEYAVISAAAEKNKSVFVKKAFASGHAVDAKTVLPFILKESAVASVIVGTVSADHLLENAQVVLV